MEQAPQQNQPKKIWMNLTYIEIGLILAVAGYFIYLGYSTRLVLNTNNTNQTIVVNGIEQKVNKTLYLPNDYVPASNISNAQSFFGIALFAIAVFVLLSKISKINKRATIQEAITDIANQLIQVRQLKEARKSVVKNGLKISSDDEDIYLTYNFLTVYKSKGEEREAHRYVIHADIYNKTDEAHQYSKAYYHPQSRYWDAFIKVDEELTESDRCQKCGTEYDEKIIISEDIRKYKSLRDLGLLKG